jgi:hypothetical protein
MLKKEDPSALKRKVPPERISDAAIISAENINTNPNIFFKLSTPLFQEPKSYRPCADAFRRHTVNQAISLQWQEKDHPRLCVRQVPEH